MSCEHTVGSNVVIRCDRCHRVADQYAAEPAPRTAGQQLPSGWEWQASLHTCPSCLARRACAAAGHDFGPWAELPDTADDLVERVCLACGVDELAPAYVLAPRRRVAS